MLRRAERIETGIKKVKEMDPDEMKTIWLIPYKRAPADPEFLMKSKSGRKMDPIEIEEYYHYLFERNHDKFIK